MIFIILTQNTSNRPIPKTFFFFSKHLIGSNFAANVSFLKIAVNSTFETQDTVKTELVQSRRRQLRQIN